MSYEGFGFPSSQKTQSFNIVRIGGDPNPTNADQYISLQVRKGTTDVKDITCQDITNAGGIDTQTLRAQSRIDTEGSLDYYATDSFGSTNRRWSQSIRQNDGDLLLDRYDDFGIYLDNVWTIDNQTGTFVFNFDIETTNLEVSNIQGKEGDPLTITSAIGQDLILDSGSDIIRLSDDALLAVGSLQVPLITTDDGPLTVIPQSRVVNFSESSLEDITVIKGAEGQNLQIETDLDLSFIVGTGNVSFGTASISAQEVVVANVDTATVSVDTVFGKTDLNLRSNLGEINIESQTSYGINLSSGSGKINMGEADLEDVQQIFATSVQANSLSSEMSTLTLTSGANSIILDAANDCINLTGGKLLNVGTTITGQGDLEIGASGNLTINPTGDVLLIDADLMIFETDSPSVAISTQNRNLLLNTGSMATTILEGNLQVGSTIGINGTSGDISGLRFSNKRRRRVIPAGGNVVVGGVNPTTKEIDSGYSYEILGSSSLLPNSTNSANTFLSLGSYFDTGTFDFRGVLRTRRGGDGSTESGTGQRPWQVNQNAAYNIHHVYKSDTYPDPRPFFGGIGTAIGTRETFNGFGTDSEYMAGIRVPLNMAEGLSDGVHGVRIDRVTIPIFFQNTHSVRKMRIVRYTWGTGDLAPSVVEYDDQTETVLANDVSVPRTGQIDRMNMFTLVPDPVANVILPVSGDDIASTIVVEVDVLISSGHVVFPPLIVEYTEIFETV